MRIISGTHGGRRIQPPSNMPHTRPTTDIAKEGLFNILQNNLAFESMKTLDLFGGTGCITYELSSRGVSQSVIVEKDPKMASFIQKTSQTLGFEHIQLHRIDVFQYIQQCKHKFDLIFAGPPYALGTIDELPRQIFHHGLLNPGGWFVLEHTPRNDYKQFLHYRTERNYGTTIFSIFIQPET